MRIKFLLNNSFVETETHPAKSLLDFLRKEKNLTGPKEVCKEGDCGACTVLIGEIINNELIYKSIASCIFPIAKANGKHVVTIEGLSEPKLNFIQKHFATEGAAQCGFCTPGYISSLTNYFMSNADYNFSTATLAISGNVCRCTGYGSIKRAVKNMVDELKNSSANSEERLRMLVEKNVIPKYFLSVKEKLLALETGETLPTQTTQKFKIAGGTDLLVQLPDLLQKQEITILNETHAEKITSGNGKITVNALTTFEEFSHSELIRKHFGNFDKFSRLIASPLIRNVATIGGNIVNASPIGDFSIILLALNAVLTLVNGKNERKVPLKDFYKGYKKLDLNENEIITRIDFEEPGEKSKFNFEKVSKRTHLDIASVNSAIILSVNEENIIEKVSVSAGGVAPVPKLLSATNTFLTNKPLSAETIKRALEIAQEEIVPISDVRGSEQYKRKLLNRLITAHFVSLFPEKIEIGELL